MIEDSVTVHGVNLLSVSSTNGQDSATKFFCSFGSDSIPQTKTTISIRSNGNSPLYILDGKECSIEDVDVSTVESISVLKDKSSTLVYGERGKNGIILITSKKK